MPCSLRLLTLRSFFGRCLSLSFSFTLCYHLIPSITISDQIVDLLSKKEVISLAPKQPRNARHFAELCRSTSRLTLINKVSINSTF